MKNATLLPVLLCAGLLFNVLDSLLGPNEAKADVCFYIEMYDSFGDGWNGGSYEIYNWNSTLIGSGTLGSGSYDWDYYCVPDGCYTINVYAGDFPSEISWDILTTGVIASGGAPVYDQGFVLGTVTYGCTDASADNYSPGYTCDDGSCCYSNYVYVEYFDSFGDGWNGATLSLANNLGTVVYSGTLDSGTFDFDVICVDDGCYTVTVTEGYFPTEISWQIYSYSWFYGFQLLREGTAPTTDQFGIGEPCQGPGCVNATACNYNPYAAYQYGKCCLDNCVTLLMQDSYGDGWNSAEFTIRDWNGEVRDHGTLYSGYYGYELACLPDGCYTFELTGGNFPGEIDWTLFGEGLYFTGTAPAVLDFSVGTTVPGCTEPYASNYNADATCDNGSCIVTCDADLNNDGVVNVTDLLLFMSQFGAPC